MLLVLGRGQALRWERFAVVALEGVLYAVAMRALASYVVGRVHLAQGEPEFGPFSGISTNTSISDSGWTAWRRSQGSECSN